ncbi:YbaN family protein [Vibrio europaeus]|uniref:Inner membrane protein n=1 Tax=Vibrio europaeus TaxID=300876 RepID=A0A178JCK7_9VIBR|nr:YbaN family protein [Vibrio europaeus]MDC5703660.1 YbaN family protein [Vibrio europaeus]MDC5711185.1 YbaN family protein [Vibrio europaeus]MDC5714678.1 YbaN family protein [Vibrio europaeus]MDC5722422.1 YbaN family protein [Vibrio europaeus]MDC5727297.1 YbaN family protein [Vibrio europaeus]
MLIRRLFLNFVGVLSLILGFIGIFLPLLPTTPFILLASACFMRSSPKFHRWLHQHKIFGPILTNWHQNGSVTAKVKKRGVICILISFAFSIWVVPHFWLKIALVLMLIILLSWFIRLPVTEYLADREENH